jgi:Fe-S-cluster containining protein
MKLDVLKPQSPAWYAEGLDFTCTQCGNCCTGGPGYVWISRDEVKILAQHLGITPKETIATYCRRIGGKLSLKENRTAEGNYDCVFLKEIPVGPGGELPVQPRKVCSVYDARPLQCRTWPFWEGNLTSRRKWNETARRCTGINEGRHFTRQEIERIRDAAQWPANPPSSD